MPLKEILPLVVVLVALCRAVVAAPARASLESGIGDSLVAAQARSKRSVVPAFTATELKDSSVLRRQRRATKRSKRRAWGSAVGDGDRQALVEALAQMGDDELNTLAYLLDQYGGGAAEEPLYYDEPAAEGRFVDAYDRPYEDDEPLWRSRRADAMPLADYGDDDDEMAPPPRQFVLVDAEALAALIDELELRTRVDELAAQLSERYGV